MMLPLRRRWYHRLLWALGLRIVCPTCLNTGGYWIHQGENRFWLHCGECLGGEKVR